MSLKEPIAPFDPESEEDVRIRVAQYFVELGFEPDEMRFEDSFRITLGRNTLVVTKGGDYIDSLTGRSDMLLTHAGRPFAIVETKRPDHTITDDDRDQAISYARLLQEIAPLAFVTNGLELRAYDVYTTRRLEESLGESVWQQKATPDIEEDFRHEAARKLIGLNFTTLREFCSKQRDMGMADLRGSINERKKYVPELYESREAIENDFAQFLDSDSPCFAVVSESGIGKTNVLCALAEQYGSRFPTLFYWAARLPHGVTDAIVDDFIWEFSRERHIAYIVERIDGLATKHDIPFFIFVDALDEYTGSTEQLRNELLSFVQHLSGRRIKLCLSCKAFDWERFVIDSGTTYNILAKAVFPKRDEVHRPERLVVPRPQDVGSWLEQFTDNELERSWKRYQSAYKLDGSLTGETRQECHYPLLLRLVAETYSGSNQEIPAMLSHVQVFTTYWERRLAEISPTQRHYATQIVCNAAETMVVSDSAEIDESTFRGSLSLPTPSAEEAYESVLRLQLLERRGEGTRGTRLAFPFELLRPFVFTILARKWTDCPEEKEVEEFKELYDSSLGREAIIFFLTVVDRGTSGLLTHLAENDLMLYIRLIHEQALQSPASVVLSVEEQQELVTRRLDQFAASYSVLLHTHFPNLVDRFEPYTQQEIGLAVFWPYYAFRPITPRYPHRVFYLSGSPSLPEFSDPGNVIWHNLPRVFLERMLGERAPELLDRMHCGRITSEHSEDLLRQLPQAVAWTVITEQIETLLSEQFLNESDTPRILQEKANDILLGRPTIAVQGSPRGRYWEQLGYSSLEELYGAPIQKLLERVHELIQRFVNAMFADGPTKGWYETSLRELLQLVFHLRQLAWKQIPLRPRDFDLSDLFSYLRSGSYDHTVELLQGFLPDVVETYQVLIQSNFPSLADSFLLYRHRDAQLVVEVTHAQSRFPTDFLQVLFLALPSVESSGEVPVFFSPWAESLAEVSPLHVRSGGNLFATGEVQVRMTGKMISDANGIFNRVSFPSRLPVTDLVYQLIANEAESVFGRRDLHSLRLRGPSSHYKGEVILRYLAGRQSSAR
jgi:hypothetical protein